MGYKFPRYLPTIKSYKNVNYKLSSLDSTVSQISFNVLLIIYSVL